MKNKQLKALTIVATSLFALTGCKNSEKVPCEHAFTDWVVISEAKCEVDGLKERTCTKCGDKETDTIEKLNHSFTTYVSDGNATCTEDGTETAHCDHEGCDKTSTRYEINSRLGHSFTNFIYNEDATCDKDGTETAHCDHEGCNETFTRTAENTKGHSFTQFEYNNDATCTEDGTETACCDYEGCIHTYTRTAVDTKLGHAFNNYTSNNDATCEHKGTMTAICEREGCSETSTIEDEDGILAHKCIQNSDLFTATCSLCGKTEDIFDYLDLGTMQYILELTEMGNCLEELTFNHSMVLYSSIEYSRCKNLKKVTIDNYDGYFDFAPNSFNDMPNLEEIIINVCLKNISVYALNNLPKLKTIRFNGLDLSGGFNLYAVQNLPSLETIYTNTTMDNWLAFNKSDYWHDDSIKNVKIICTDGVLDIDGNRIPD